MTRRYFITAPVRGDDRAEPCSQISANHTLLLNLSRAYVRCFNACSNFTDISGECW